ncbi:MAG: glutathione peroxidase [Planctomycetota bacterium]|nr:glutathione peroxidase [Planctomycetota bacterium]
MHFSACDNRVVTAPIAANSPATDILSIPAPTLDGGMTDLSAYRGQVLLIVNVASECGYTKQYAGLQELHDKFKGQGEGQGFSVIAFPCNDFGGQEPGGKTEIAACAARFNATFPIMGKVRVKAGEIDGAKQSELYATLGDATGQLPVWNFGKYLIGRDGKPVAFFGTAIDPMSPEVVAAVEGVVGNRASSPTN